MTFTSLTDRVLVFKPADVLNLYLPFSDVSNRDNQFLADHPHTMAICGIICGCGYMLTRASVHISCV